MVSQWNDGFQAEVTVRNGTPTTTSAWTAALNFTNGQQLTQAWNAAVASNGTIVTAQNLTWNGTLTPNSTATFGFLARWSGTNTPPTVNCTFG